MARKPQSECQFGHAMDGDNIIWRTRKGKRIRECRACANRRARAARKARKRNAIINQQFTSQVVVG